MEIWGSPLSFISYWPENSKTWRVRSAGAGSSLCYVVEVERIWRDL